MGDVFISYKAEDRARVTPLVDALQADGQSLWWDVHIAGGTSWRQAIQDRLDAARCVLVVWSGISVGPAGHFVHDEATRAQRRGVYLPVRIDAVEPPIGFGETQALDLIGWKGDRRDPRYQVVLASIRAVVAGDPKPVPRAVAARPHRPDRRLVLAGGGAAGLAAAGGAYWWRRSHALATNAIAVLPFQNLSGDPAQAYFSDGMSEELRDTLARLPGLQVAARISSDLFRDARDVATVASKLGVAHVLDGSVRRAGNLIRVSAQLIDGVSGLERWSQSYDRAAGDSLAVQSDIAGNVARALSVALGAGGAAALQAGGTHDPAAHEQYLKGLAILDRGGGDGSDLNAARANFEAAVTIDPTYAAAHAGRARAIAGIANSFATADSAGALYQAALGSARQAIQLAPSYPQGHFVLGYVQAGLLQIRAAIAPFERARQLGAGDAEILTGYAGFVARLARAGDAAAAIDRAARLDPLNPRVHIVRGATLLAARRYPDAITAYRAALALNPNAAILHWSIGDCLYLQGRTDEAAREYALEKVAWARATGEGMVAWKRGDRRAADKALAVLTADGGADYQIADLLAQRGDVAGALATLEKAWAVRDGGLGSLKTDPMLDPLRTQPRFIALMRQVGFD